MGKAIGKEHKGDNFKQDRDRYCCDRIDDENDKQLTGKNNKRELLGEELGKEIEEEDNRRELLCEPEEELEEEEEELRPEKDDELINKKS